MCGLILFVLVQTVTFSRLPLSGWCVWGGVVQWPIPEVVAPLDISALLEDGVNQILVHRLFGGVCVERVSGGVLHWLVSENVWVVEKAVEGQDVNGHHQNRPTGIESFCEEGLCLLVFGQQLAIYEFFGDQLVTISDSALENGDAFKCCLWWEKTMFVLCITTTI